MVQSPLQTLRRAAMTGPRVVPDGPKGRTIRIPMSEWRANCEYPDDLGATAFTSDDTAYVNWSSGWRAPAVAELLGENTVGATARRPWQLRAWEVLQELNASGPFLSGWALPPWVRADPNPIPRIVLFPRASRLHRRLGRATVEAWHRITDAWLILRRGSVFRHGDW